MALLPLAAALLAMGSQPHAEPAQNPVVLTSGPLMAYVTPSPTPSPTPAPTPAPEPLASYLTPAPLPAVPVTGIERLVCARDWPCGEALAIMWCESGGKPDTWVLWTKTPDPNDGVAGLFQIATHANGKRQWIGWDLFDPAQNIEAAYIMWSGNGGNWYPDWACHPW